MTNTNAPASLRPLLDRASEVVGEPVEAVGFFRSAAHGRTASLTRILTVRFIIVALAITAVLTWGLQREGAFIVRPIRYVLAILLACSALVAVAVWAGRALADRMSRGSTVGSLPERVVLAVTASKVHLFKWDITWLPVYWHMTGGRGQTIRPAFGAWPRTDVSVAERTEKGVRLELVGQDGLVEIEPMDEWLKAKEDILIAAAKVTPDMAVRSAGWEQVVGLLSPRQP